MHHDLPRHKSSAAKPDIRLVAVDLDGTLLDRGRRVCSAAAEALMRLPERGVMTVIASARPPRSVRQIYQSLKLDTWQINYNGALIWDEPGAKVVEHTPLDCRLVRQLIDRTRDRYDDVSVSCEILDRWYTDRIEQPYKTETARLYEPDVVAPVDQICSEPITKLMLLGDEQMMLDLEVMLRIADDITVVRSDPHLIQITHRTASKAAALRTVAGRYGVTMEQMMAIGDAANDISMLQEAGVGVAMGNASGIVKAAADWVAPNNDDRGVHAALARFGLA